MSLFADRQTPLIAISSEETPFPEYISESKINVCIEFENIHYIFDLKKLANILDIVKCKKSQKEEFYRFIDFDQLGIPGLVTYLDMFSILVFQSSYSEWENDDRNHPKNLSYKELQRHHCYYTFVKEQDIEIVTQTDEKKEMILAYLMIQPERNPNPFNRIGYNPLTGKEISLYEIKPENTNVCIWFRSIYYLLDLHKIHDHMIQMNKNKKNLYECDGNEVYFVFDEFGIPELVLEMTKLYEVVFGFGVLSDDIEYTNAEIEKYLRKRPRYYKIYSTQHSPIQLDRLNGNCKNEPMLSRGLITFMEPPSAPKSNPTPNNTIGLNPLSLEQSSLSDFIGDNTNVCIQYRQTNYVFDLSILKTQLEKDDKWYEKCEKPDTLDPIRYFNFSDYGIPDLALNYANFENVVLGEGFNGPGYDEPQDYKTRPKYYRIIEKGRMKLDRSEWKDPDRSGIYNCENENIYTFGVIEFMKPPGKSKSKKTKTKTKTPTKILYKMKSYRQQKRRTKKKT